jgi:hypothetical protein
MNIFRYLMITGILASSAGILQAQDAEIILSSVKKEIERNKSELKIDRLQPPFYINYVVVNSKHLNVNASLGSLITSEENTTRSGFPCLLVGNYDRNNAGYIDMNALSRRRYPKNICLEDDQTGIATTIWLDLDEDYKNESERYEAKIATMRQQNIKEEDLAVADFEKVEPIHIIQNMADIQQDKKYWEEYVEKASAALRKYTSLRYSNISAYVRNSGLYYYDTENSQYAIQSPYCRLQLHLEATTPDGQDLYDNMYIEYGRPEQMPDLETFTKECVAFTESFLELLDAPLFDDAYSGPVLFEGQSAVESIQEKFMNQQALFAKPKPVVNDNVRQYVRGGDLFSPNNLEMMMNKKVTSRSLSIKAVTGLESYEGIKLEGYYPVDFEGVVPEKEFYLVENGVLRSMLNRRQPTKKISGSNGHFRFNFNSGNPQIGPGNLLVTSTDTYSKEALKQKLIDAAKEEDLDYAFIVRRMWGNNIIRIYKINVADGSEELVRGAKMEGFSMKSFKRILGAANQNVVRNTNNFGSLATYIVPDGILFEELEVTRDGGMNLKTPHVVPKPTFVNP